MRGEKPSLFFFISDWLRMQWSLIFSQSLISSSNPNLTSAIYSNFSTFAPCSLKKNIAQIEIHLGATITKTNKQTTLSRVSLVYICLSWYHKLAFIEVSKYTHSIKLTLHTEKMEIKLTSFASL